MAWLTAEDQRNSELTLGRFTLRAYKRHDRFDWEIYVRCEDFNPDAVCASGTGENLDLEDAQDEALNALNEILVEARAALDHHLEKRWAEETGRAHVAEQR